MKRRRHHGRAVCKVLARPVLGRADRWMSPLAGTDQEAWPEDGAGTDRRACPSEEEVGEHRVGSAVADGPGRDCGAVGDREPHERLGQVRDAADQRDQPDVARPAGQARERQVDQRSDEQVGRPAVRVVEPPRRASPSRYRARAGRGGRPAGCRGGAPDHERREKDQAGVLRLKLATQVRAGPGGPPLLARSTSGTKWA